MPTLDYDDSLTPHLAGALEDYVAKLREFRDTTGSKAEKASYDRTIAGIRELIDAVGRQA